jgi:hypothetical protein
MGAPQRSSWWPPCRRGTGDKSKASNASEAVADRAARSADRLLVTAVLRPAAASSRRPGDTGAHSRGRTSRPLAATFRCSPCAST